MKATYRQAQILRIVQSKRVHTQEELVQELAGRGIETTQVTLSRDIRKLGLAKTHEGYVVAGAAAPAARPSELASAAAELIEDVRVAQNIVVLKTPAGKANALAVELDRVNWPEEVGSVAGDDTILIVTPDNAAAARLRKKLIALVQ